VVAARGEEGGPAERAERVAVSDMCACSLEGRTSQTLGQTVRGVCCIVSIC